MPTDIAAALQEHRTFRTQLLAAFPELAEDEETLRDTLEGISDLDQQILAALRHAIEREAHGKAIAELVETMTARKRRLEEGARAIRGAALHAMQEAGLKKLAAADMTVSVGTGKAKVIITDDQAVPDDLCRVTRTPSKTDIAKALSEGREVPGIILGNPEPFLSVHRK
jgi:type I site-specific restriction endonuclease